MMSCSPARSTLRLGPVARVTWHEPSRAANPGPWSSSSQGGSMLCPVCRHDNLQGEDNCENCGADLRTADIPEQAVSFHGRLLGEHLDDLGVGKPVIAEGSTTLGTALARM